MPAAVFIVRSTVADPAKRTTFDKWSLIPEVDSDYRVVGTVHTYF